MKCPTCLEVPTTSGCRCNQTFFVEVKTRLFKNEIHVREVLEGEPEMRANYDFSKGKSRSEMKRVSHQIRDELEVIRAENVKYKSLCEELAEALRAALHGNLTPTGVNFCHEALAKYKADGEEMNL